MRLNLLVIRTAKMETLKEMYELLGFQFEYHQHGNGPFHYASEQDGVVFEIYPKINSERNVFENIRLGFEVANLNTLMNRLKSSNWEILTDITQTEWGEVAVVQDIDGRKVELKLAS